MAGDFDFEKALNRVEHCLTAIGDGVEDELTDDDDQVIGFTSQRWGNLYYILGSSESQFFHIIYPYSLVGSLEGVLDEQSAEEVLDGIDRTALEGTEERQAAEHLMNVMPEHIREELRFHLHEKVTTPQTSSVIFTSEIGGITRFEVRSRVYPLADDFSLHMFENAVQAVMNVGTNAGQFLSYAFDIEEYVDSRTPSEVTQPHYIQ